MSDIREILNRLNSGEITAADVPDEMILQVAAEVLFVEAEGQDEILTRLSPLPVSYTHLTLPTIYSV